MKPYFGYPWAFVLALHYGLSRFSNCIREIYPFAPIFDTMPIVENEENLLKIYEEDLEKFMLPLYNS